MHKSLFFIVLIILVIFSSCNDFTSGVADEEETPVDIVTVAKGAFVNPGEIIEVDYLFNREDPVITVVFVTVTDSSGDVVFENSTESMVADDFTDYVKIDDYLLPGVYSLRFDFYSGDELVYQDSREIFVTTGIFSIDSMTSYPPVLYPGGGGLLYADVVSSESSCWLRWTLDGEVIAEGLLEDGYSGIEIAAPDAEGVYDLSLEVFPFAPGDDRIYDFESFVTKKIPVYINKEQNPAANEYAPENKFYDLFHFRGNLINSIESDNPVNQTLIPEGNPEMSVIDGIFGYYFEGSGSLASDSLMLPLADGSHAGFSVMLSMIPYLISGSNETDEYDELFYSGLKDGSFYISAGVNQKGGLNAVLKYGESVYELETSEGIVRDNEYFSLGLALEPGITNYKLSMNVNGEPAAEKVIDVVEEEGPFTDLHVENEEAATVLLGGNRVAVLLDEFGVYSDLIDPHQFRRAMLLEYGKSLVFAEGFDGNETELIYRAEDAHIKNSSLFVKPGGQVEFPELLPAYEELTFIAEIAEGGGAVTEVIFTLYEDLEETKLISAGFNEKNSFSLVFKSGELILETGGAELQAVNLPDDFNKIIYSFNNNSTEEFIELKSFLVLRKSIDISAGEAETKSGTESRS